MRSRHVCRINSYVITIGLWTVPVCVCVSLKDSLAYKVYHNKMEDDVSKYEIPKGSLRSDAFEQRLVIFIALKSQTH